MLPAFEQRFKDVALVHLGVAEQRDHAAFRPLRAESFGAQVILHERSEQSLCYAQADRARGEVHVVDVLRSRGVGLRAFEAAEILDLLEALIAEKILNRMENRA